MNTWASRILRTSSRACYNLKTSEFDYELPTQYIAQSPVEPRDHSRLMVLDRQAGEIQHVHFYDLGKFLHPGDVLVLNETRVIPARLYGRKVPSGGRVELLLVRRLDDLTWEALGGGKGLVFGWTTARLSFLLPGGTL